MIESSLPPELLAYADRSPVEDLALTILRSRLPWVEITDWIKEDATFPFVLVRRSSSFGARTTDTRFLDVATITISTFTMGLEADADGAILSDAVRKALYDAYYSQEVFPGMGHLTNIANPTVARRVTDWASSVGPVQYADLPQGVIRYESIFDLEIKLPRTPFFRT